MHCLLEIRDVLFFVYVIISHHSSLEEVLLLVVSFLIGTLKFKEGILEDSRRLEDLLV